MKWKKFSKLLQETKKLDMPGENLMSREFLERAIKDTNI